MLHILKCRNCGKYTLKKKCACGEETKSQAPAKYNPEDKFAKYRRKAKEIAKVSK